MRIRFIIAFLLLLSVPAVAQFSKSTINSQINSQFPDQNTGQITPATTRAFLANMLNSYQQYVGYNKQVGATYTIQGSDYGQIVTFNSLTTVNVTLTPANATGFTTFNFFTQNLSTGNVVFNPTGGSTVCGGASITLANTQSAWIVSDGTNWQCQFGIAGAQLANPLGIANGGTNATAAGGLLLDNISGFTTTGFLARTATNTYQINTFNGGLTPANITLSNLTTLCNLTGSNAQSCSPGQMSAVLCTPTRTNFITASGTYTTAQCNGVLASYLVVDLQGGGAGGSGSGTTVPAGGVGGNTTFGGVLTASGGAGGVNEVGGAGGTCAGSLGTQTNFIGGNGSGVSSVAAQPQPGGRGGISYYGGSAGPSESAAAGLAAATGTGGGGSGGGGNATAGVFGGAGGGAGCHIKTLIIAPASSYVWAVGQGGNGGGAGTSGVAGGAGASGQVDIWAHWQ